ncbi:uncharacterized protein VTP21DRAFT_3305 [Calcarisporiella thermophila]|uniref:uncharacterized protein n=1 Tax=Calcarisporiella thermophila TaxID=911321 RepID=UPI003743368D
MSAREREQRRNSTLKFPSLLTPDASSEAKLFNFQLRPRSVSDATCLHPAATTSNEPGPPRGSPFRRSLTFLKQGPVITETSPSSPVLVGGAQPTIIKRRGSRSAEADKEVALNEPQSDKERPVPRRSISLMADHPGEPEQTWGVSRDEKGESPSNHPMTSDVTCMTSSPSEEWSIWPLTKTQRKFQRYFPEIAVEAIWVKRCFTCALDRDALWQGQLYCTRQYVCFYGRLFNKATRILIHRLDLTAVDKDVRLKVIPNTLRISTSQKTYILTNFLARDAAYEDICEVWRSCTVGDTYDPLAVDISDDSFTASSEMARSISENSFLGKDDYAFGYVPPSPVLDPDYFLAPSVPVLAENLAQRAGERRRSRDLSLPPYATQPHANTVEGAKGEMRVDRLAEKEDMGEVYWKELLEDGKEAELEISSDLRRVPEPREKLASEKCTCAEHPKHELVNVVIALPPTTVFELLFGEKGGDIVRRAHQIRGTLSLDVSDWTERVEGSTEEKPMLERELKYRACFRVLRHRAVTNCIEVQRRHPHELVVESRSRTPQVPFGDVFETVYRCCLTKERNKTRLRVTAGVLFRKSLLFEGVIERTAMDGMGSYFQEILSLLHAAESVRPTRRSLHSRLGETPGTPRVSLRRRARTRGSSSSRHDMLSETQGEASVPRIPEQERPKSLVEAEPSYPIFKLFTSLFVGFIALLRSAATREGIGRANQAMPRNNDRVMGGGETRERDAPFSRRLAFAFIVMGLVITAMSVSRLRQLEKRLADEGWCDNPQGAGYSQEDLGLGQYEAWRPLSDLLTERIQGGQGRMPHIAVEPLRKRAQWLQSELRDIERMLSELDLV